MAKFIKKSSEIYWFCWSFSMVVNVRRLLYYRRIRWLFATRIVVCGWIQYWTPPIQLLSSRPCCDGYTGAHADVATSVSWGSKYRNTYKHNEQCCQGHCKYGVRRIVVCIVATCWAFDQLRNQYALNTCNKIDFSCFTETMRTPINTNKYNIARKPLAPTACTLLKFLAP